MVRVDCRQMRVSDRVMVEDSWIFPVCGCGCVEWWEVADLDERWIQRWRLSVRSQMVLLIHHSDLTESL